MPEEPAFISDQDAQLLEQLRQGNRQAVTAWFNQYQARLLRYVIARVTVEKDAEEIVQETFLNCLKHMPLFRGNASIWTWMCGIAKHEVADYFRKKYAKKAIKTLPLGELLLAQGTHDASDTAVAVRKVLKQMGQHSTELLMAKYVDNKQVKELAQELGRSVKAIESDLFRARQEFKVLWATYNSSNAG